MRGSLEKRLLAHSKRWNNCLVWQLSGLAKGYGQIWVGPGKGHMRLAHRISYELWVGPIPEGWEIDHLCKNKACIEPTHLEAVSREEHQRRTDQGAFNLAKTQCPEGHAYDETNTYRHGTRRHCKTCRRARVRRWREQQKAKLTPDAPR